MKYQTNAYLKWKEQTQAVFDFSVLMSYAVPSLKQKIKLIESSGKGTLARPDYYRSHKNNAYTSSHLFKSLSGRARGYKNQLSKYMLLSVFSFFEAFTSDIVEEFFLFHGGVKERNNLLEKKIVAQFQRVDSLVIDLSVLRSRKKFEKGRQMEKANILSQEGYLFPSDLLSIYSIKRINQTINSLKAKDILLFLEEVFLMEFSNKEKTNYQSLRQFRNQIAHGESINLSIKQVTEHNKILISLAKKINRHIVAHFFVKEFI
jgi:hypothetical protein